MIRPVLRTTMRMITVPSSSSLLLHLRFVFYLAFIICCCVPFGATLPGDMILEGYGIRHSLEHSFKQPYYFRDGTVPNFQTFGNVEKLSDSIRLTKNAPMQSGAIWCQNRNLFDEWAVVINMNVMGDNPLVGGEGIAFWYTKEPNQLGPIFGSRDSWTGIGILLDSFDNEKTSPNPVILASYNGGNYNYNYEGDGEGHVFAHCFKDYRNHPFLLKVVYYNRTLTLEIDLDGNGYDFQKCFTYSPIYLTPKYYFGISALTKHIPDMHEVISFDVYEINDKYKKAKKPIDLAKDQQIEIKEHEELQQKIRDMLSKGEKTSGQIDLKVIHAQLSRIEERQNTMYDMLSEHVDDPGEIIPGHEHIEPIKEITNRHNQAIISRIEALENTMKGIMDNMVTLTRAVQELHGSNRGAQSVMNQVAQLNELTHNKLTYLEDNSKKTFERADTFHQVFEEKESKYFYYFICFLILQLAILFYFFIVKKKPNGNGASSYDRKFI